MKLSIITWSENIYDFFIQIMKNEKIIHYGNWFYLIFHKKNDIIGLKLNYGVKSKNDVAILVKCKEKFMTVPYLEEAYRIDYQYEPLEFSQIEIMKLISEDEKKYIKEININDIILCWFIQSNFRDYFSTIEDYKKALSREVYFSDYEEINNDIENGLLKIFNIENGEIVNIEDVKTKKLSLYLNNGIVWEAFLKDTENNIYLNTGLNISLKIL